MHLLKKILGGIVINEDPDLTIPEDLVCTDCICYFVRKSGIQNFWTITVIVDNI